MLGIGDKNMEFNPQAKIVKHPELLKYLNGYQIVPINIEVSTCGFCNASCPWCFYSNEQLKKNLDTDIISKFLLDVELFGVKAITFTGGGEPTLHPDFNKIIALTNMDKGLITNALKIPKFDPTIFSWIRVSKTDKELNLESLKILRECRKIGICINYTGDEDELKRILEVAYKIDVDYVQVRPALNMNGEKTFIKVPSITDSKLLITEYKFEEAKKDREYKKCEGFHFVPFLWEDGRLDVCAYMRFNQEYNIGNIYENTFEELLVNFKPFVKVSKQCQICCKNHEINKMIFNLRNIDDVNFV